MTPVDTAINAFGGVREMARAIDVAASSVSRWELIPPRMIPVVLMAAKARGIHLSAEHLIIGTPGIARARGTVAAHGTTELRDSSPLGYMAHALTIMGACHA